MQDDTTRRSHSRRSGPDPDREKRSIRWLALMCLTGMMSVGCTNGKVVDERLPDRADGTGLQPAPEPPAAYWRDGGTDGRGRAVPALPVRETMIELSGSRALQEMVLDDMLERACGRQGIVVDERTIRMEERLLLENLDEDPDHAMRLLDELRRREGLGPRRYLALLRRNGMLRSLVAPDVEVTDEAIRAVWDREHGPRRVARIVVVGDLESIGGIRSALEEGRSFAEVAARFSNDPSGSTGGLVDPVARLDPSWPTTFREQLWSLEPGAISTPILVDDAYVLVKYVEELPGDGTSLEAARERSASIVQRAQERLLMDATAKRMLDGVEIDVVDRDLDRAWRDR